MWTALERPWTPPRWAVIKDARRRQRRRQRRMLAGAAVLLLSAAVGWEVAGTSMSGPVPTARSVAVATARPVDLGGVVQGATTLGTKLWVLTCLRRCSLASSPAAGDLLELAANGRPIRRTRVADPTAVTSGAGALWIAHFDTGEVSRIDPHTGRTTAETRLQLPARTTTNGWRRFEPQGISFGAGRLWVSDAFGFVAEINPVTMRLQRMIFTSSEVTSATTAAGLTWIADELDGVGTFPPGSHNVQTHHIQWLGQPVDIQTVARGAGVIWALGTQTSYVDSLTHPTTAGVVTALDSHTGRVAQQWQISPAAAGLVVASGGVYVGDGGDGRLLRLAPGHRVQALEVPGAVSPTAATRNALWAISRRGQLLRIGLRLR